MNIVIIDLEQEEVEYFKTFFLLEGKITRYNHNRVK